MPLEEQVSSDAPLDAVPPPMPEYDPRVQPTSHSPAPSSQSAPGDGGTPGADVPAEEGQQPLPEFDPRYRTQFEGLMYIGALTDEFDWMGHKFVVRTLRTDELLEIALMIQPYVGTQGEDKAYQAGVVAACVISVDGKPLPSPISSDPADTPLSNRYRYVKQYWYGPTLDAIYQRYYRLELTVREVLEAMGNRSG